MIRFFRRFRLDRPIAPDGGPARRGSAAGRSARQSQRWLLVWLCAGLLVFQGLNAGSHPISHLGALLERADAPAWTAPEAGAACEWCALLSQSGESLSPAAPATALAVARIDVDATAVETPSVSRLAPYRARAPPA